MQSVWKNNEILSRFSRYYAIINKEKVARYLITKKVPAALEIDSSIPTAKLWDTHDRTVGKFNTLLRELDNQENPIDYYSKLDSPQTTFLDLKIELAHRILKDCHFCGRECALIGKKRRALAI